MPSSVTIISPNTSVTFAVTATQDSDDDDGESVRLSFGALTARRRHGGHAQRIDDLDHG